MVVGNNMNLELKIKDALKLSKIMVKGSKNIRWSISFNTELKSGVFYC